ncbi:hypothetical protein F5Y07DRAFT_403221 [Xylaria sp. FL0933]|nr:hypothetical protein F5Y07DRAFT_403221 [Xylaria sp. FL0933]
MYCPKALLFIAAMVGTSLAQDVDSPECSSKMSSFFSWAVAEGPTTPAAVLSFIATAPNSQPPLSTFGPEAHGEEICSIYKKLPPSLLPEFKTYIASVLEFGKENSQSLLDVASTCVPPENLASVTSYIHQMLTPTGNQCETTPTPTPGGAANGTYPTSPALTATASYSYPTSNTTYTTSIVTAAAARPTGVWLGAAAIGGVLGAAAML